MFPWRTRYPDVEIGYPGVLMLVSPQHIVAFEGFLTALQIAATDTHLPVLLLVLV